MVPKAAKVKRYEQRGKQFKQNRLFDQDKKRFCQRLYSNTRQESTIPDAEESKEFWSDIWRKRKEHNKEAEWLGQLKEELGNQQQENIIITKDMAPKQCKRMPNLKTLGTDGVKGFWLKKLTSRNERIAEQLSLIVNGDAEVLSWLTLGRTILCLKDPNKGNAVDNYQPISCLPMIWKLFTGVIADGIYQYLAKNKVLPEEQKGCRRRSKGTKVQILIDKAILLDCRKWHTQPWQ